MRIKRGINVETGISKVIKALLSMRSVLAHAEEPVNTGEGKSSGEGNDPTPNQTPTNDPTPTGNPTQTNDPVINYEDLISKARKEEKDKLYPQITSLKNKVTELTNSNNSNLLEIGKKDARIRELEEQLTKAQSGGMNESDVVKDLNNQIATLKKELKETKDSIVSRDVIENEVKAEYEIKLYKQQVLSDNKGAIIPELVMGTTKEEIDASLEVAKNRYNDIVQGAVGRVKVPVANTGSGVGSSLKISVEDIANLDPRSSEYAEMRAKLGLK